MNNLFHKSTGFTPIPPKGGVKRLKDLKIPRYLGVEIDKRNWSNRFLKPPLGGLGVRKQRKFEVIGTKINRFKKRLEAPLAFA